MSRPKIEFVNLINKFKKEKRKEVEGDYIFILFT